MRSQSLPVAASGSTRTVRARAYVRVSHVGKERQDKLLSEQMQLEEARRYAAYLGFEFDIEASRRSADLDVSGFRKPWRERPGLMALYREAEQGAFDCLIFYKISRLARNVREALDLIDAFEKVGVSFHFVAERIDSSSAQGRFLRNVLLAAAEMQSEDASTFIKSACEQRARAGRLHGGNTPAWIRRTDAGFELIPEQVAAIQRLLTLRLQGLGYRKIARALNLEGFRTVRGKYWTDGMTFKYLQPSYLKSMLGVGYYGRGGTEPVEIPDAYPAIVTPEEVERLQAIQQLYSAEYGRKPVAGLDWMIARRRKVGRRSASVTHLLSGIVFCPVCGARLVAVAKSQDSNRTSNHSYTCPRATTRPGDHAVKGLASVNSLALEDAVLRVVRAILVMPPAEPPPRERKSKADPIAAIQDKIDRLVELHLDGRIQDDDFRRTYGALVAEKEAALDQERPDLVPAQLQQAAELAAKAELTRAELRQLLLLLIERVEAPFTLPGITIRRDHKSLRRLARIRFRFPVASGEQEFIAAIYDQQYQGVRQFIPASALDNDGGQALIGERSRERV